MNSIDYERVFPELYTNVLEIAVKLQNLILHIFPAAVVTSDEENVGFGYCSGYKTWSLSFPLTVSMSILAL